MKAVEWKAQRKSETKVEDRGEPEEAAAEIEAGGRRKEIAEINNGLDWKVEAFFAFRESGYSVIVDERYAETIFI